VTTEVLTYVIGAGATVRAPRGRLFFVKSAPNGGLTITASGRPGAPIKFANISAGLKYGPVDEADHWEYLEITSATAQTVELIIGDDDVEVAGTVSIAGTVSTVDAQIIVATPGDVSIPAGTTASIRAGTTVAKGLIVGNLSTNSSSVRIGNSTAAAAFGIELQPGEKIVIPATNTSIYAFNVSFCRRFSVSPELRQRQDWRRIPARRAVRRQKRGHRAHVNDNASR
jgi:hypothetical protein